MRIKEEKEIKYSRLDNEIELEEENPKRRRDNISNFKKVRNKKKEIKTKTNHLEYCCDSCCRYSFWWC